MASDEQIRAVVHSWTGIIISAIEIDKRIGQALIGQELTPRALNPYTPHGTGKILESPVRP